MRLGPEVDTLTRCSTQPEELLRLQKEKESAESIKVALGNDVNHKTRRFEAKITAVEEE